MTNQYGCLTVDRWMDYKRKGLFLRVFLDGKDVTFRGVEADDKVGYVVLLCQDKSHRDWTINNIGTHFTPDADDGPHRLKVSGDVNIVAERV